MQRRRDWGLWCELWINYKDRILPWRPRELTSNRKTKPILCRKGDLHVAYLNAGGRVYRQRKIDARHCSVAKGDKSLSTGGKGECVVPIRFLIMQRGTTLLGLKAMKQLSVSITLKAILPIHPEICRARLLPAKWTREAPKPLQYTWKCQGTQVKAVKLVNTCFTHINRTRGQKER